ncbi:unnamed protein product, partial [Nesidiocoris tenuis]
MSIPVAWTHIAGSEACGKKSFTLVHAGCVSSHPQTIDFETTFESFPLSFPIFHQRRQ